MNILSLTRVHYICADNPTVIRYYVIRTVANY